MNIFYVDECPTAAAQALMDCHVGKMCLESAQMLSSAHIILDGKEAALEKGIWYGLTHPNHKSAVWVRECVLHYQWLYDHFCALGDEYVHRHPKGKRHKSDIDLRAALQTPPVEIDQRPHFEPPPLAMPENFHSNNHVLSYRSYYQFKHRTITMRTTWERRGAPYWFSASSLLSNTSSSTLLAG